MTPDGSAWLTLDLARYHSTFGASLTAALRHDGPRRLGRPPARATRRRRDPLAEAAAYGVDLSLLRASLRRTPAERMDSLDADAAFLDAARRVRPRTAHAVTGIPGDGLS